MKLKTLSVTAFAVTCVVTTAGWAQAVQQETPAATAEPQLGDQPATAAAPTCCMLPALTPVELEIVTPASSKTSSQADRIAIRVAKSVEAGGRLLVPAGSEGFAQVIQVSRGHMGGKAGELVLGAPYLILGGQRIELKRLRYGRTGGADRAGQAIVATAVIGIAGGLIAGGNVDLPAGAHANAVVAKDTVLPREPEPSHQGVN